MSTAYTLEILIHDESYRLEAYIGENFVPSISHYSYQAERNGDQLNLTVANVTADQLNQEGHFQQILAVYGGNETYIPTNYTITANWVKTSLVKKAPHSMYTFLSIVT